MAFGGQQYVFLQQNNNNYGQKSKKKNLKKIMRENGFAAANTVS